MNDLRRIQREEEAVNAKKEAEEVRYAMLCYLLYCVSLLYLLGLPRLFEIQFLLCPFLHLI